MGNRTRSRWWLVGFGIFGAAMFYGDGMITPAISVLGAVEGLEIIAPHLHPFVVPATVMIVVALFAIQKRGTASVGLLFGPVMCLWFVVLAGLGLRQIADNPAVLGALNPAYATTFTASNPLLAFLALGAVVLAVTGTEALYADMGHFGAAPIRRAWLWFVHARPGPQLFRTGRAAARGPAGDQEPVLPARAAMGAHPAGRAGDLRGGDRVAGGDLGRLLADPRGDPDGLLPAPEDPAHVGSPDRADLHPVHQLDAARGGRAARGRVQALGQPRRRVRHRGDARDADRFGADLRRHAADLGMATAGRRPPSSCRCS